MSGEPGIAFVSVHGTGIRFDLYKASRLSHYIFLQYRIAVYYRAAKSFRWPRTYTGCRNVSQARP